ncbi:DNA-binding transcriptional regulator, MerR family [Nannocystis exedens]|uniref:DNA-binding transcriptional regulator, MerR family n=1 Tax=Nannocystis exedens TaxID=54 RepID=A0A1I1WDW9_9BACT|nr:MerR family transcriptional regulator [Nannocystis exedens]PCC67645.1 MerR family regulatory protein [Nannocystis exedens]SFD93337.1 DNA-binding transcriptional regulator, MerR family [Nannocystis exedens]
MSGADEDAGQTSRRKAGDGAASEGPSKPARTRARAKKAGAATGPDLGSDKLYFKIGEVAQIVGVPAYVLRYWETEFKVIRPQKSRTQQRVYRRRDVETLLKIKHLLYAKKFTIAGARQQLRLGGEAVEMAPPSSRYLASQSLAALRESLDDLIAWVENTEATASTAADPVEFIRTRGGARALIDEAAAAGEAQPLLQRSGREPL